MKISQWVEFSKEVEIEIDYTHVLTVFGESPDPGQTWLELLNRFAGALMKLPDAQIARFSAAHRKIIREFLMRQVERFAENEGSV